MEIARLEKVLPGNPGKLRREQGVKVLW